MPSKNRKNLKITSNIVFKKYAYTLTNHSKRPTSRKYGGTLKEPKVSITDIKEEEIIQVKSTDSMGSPSKLKHNSPRNASSKCQKLHLETEKTHADQWNENEDPD